jgi:hypothetical protein
MRKKNTLHRSITRLIFSPLPQDVIYQSLERLSPVLLSRVIQELLISKILQHSPNRLDCKQRVEKGRIVRSIHGALDIHPPEFLEELMTEARVTVGW